MVKNERERVFAYSYHTACDRNGWILQTYVTAANVHDSQAFFVLFERVKREIQSCPEAVCVDAGYKTPAIAKYLLEQGVKPIWPYTRPKTKDGFFRKSDFVYDEYFDCYLCPNDQVLSYSTTNREGYREYKSDPAVCRSCPYLHQCTQSKSYTKVVTRHVWQDYYEEAEHLRYVPEYRELYALRKETIERDFADMKEKHGLRWTHYRGLEKNEAQAMLVCAAMNLKKLANYLWKAKHRPFFSFAWLPILPTFFENIVYLWNKMGFRHSSETHFVNSLRPVRVGQVFFHRKQVAGFASKVARSRLGFENSFLNDFRKQMFPCCFLSLLRKQFFNTGLIGHSLRLHPEPTEAVFFEAHDLLIGQFCVRNDRRCARRFVNQVAGHRALKRVGDKPLPVLNRKQPDGHHIHVIPSFHTSS